ncbi:hypothetical protein NCU03553 [Neurospora crassa OR74A]|uniref:Secreted protein n=2 Tax=Neurospora crassa TaxID=5141 RepID=Q1K4M5_NEUCR|nr:hypothetical protein NCU03553 [Neurospora crassa OR74A]EAA26556.1 hypothetical protein NCU03553 [Neurospora crassa OR74A]CAD21052.1 hypothetical protein [Neurospora crassa]|eukprot:XP_955792.1 hypothetical protein NCU03553 [Neurospora crassa OR74A]
MWRPLWHLGPCVSVSVCVCVCAGGHRESQSVSQSTLELDSGIRKNGEPQARSRPSTHWPVVRDIDQECSVDASRRPGQQHPPRGSKKRKMLVDNGQRTMAVAPVFA